MKYKVLKKQNSSKSCLVCGVKNDLGLKARFYQLENGELASVFNSKEFHQSYPGRVHGGISAAILDETIGRAISVSDETVWGVTGSLELRYKKPVPIDCDIITVARVTRDTRKLFEQPQLLEAARLTGCKNSSRIERMGEYQVFALDWGISLRTEQKVELDMTHIAIRGHWIRPSEKAGENCLVFEAAEYVETTFEHQYLVKSPGMEDGAVLWWMRPKKSFTDEHDKNLPKYLYLPPEHLMLLK